MDRVDEYITGKELQGSYDSTGNFTIDLERASRLKSEYTFARPEMWVLKFLQFLTRMEATGLSMTESKGTLELLAVFENDVFQEYELDALFRLDMDTDKSDPRFPLREALSGAIASCDSVTLVWSQSDQTQRLTFQGESVEGEVQTSTWNEKELLLRVERGKLLSTFKSMFGIGIFHTEVEEIRKSSKALAYSMTLNDEHWNQSKIWPEKGDSLLEFRCEEAYTGPRFRLTQGHAFASYETELAQTLYRPGKDYSYLLALSARRENWQRASLTWILDGVPVGKDFLTEAEYFIGFHLFLSADGLSTDLSGLSLRQTPDKAERLQHLCHAVLRDIATHLPLGLIALVDSQKNRRLTVLSIPAHVSQLAVGIGRTIGIYAGRERQIREDLETCVAISEARLKKQLMDPEKWNRMDLAQLRDLADLISH